NYGSAIDPNVLAGSTVGLKGAGSSNPSRVLVNYNDPSSTLVGSDLSTQLTVPQPTNDYYSFSAVAGERITLALKGLNGSGANLNTLNPALEIYDASGNLLTSNDNGAADGRNALLNYTVAAGTYKVHVSAAAGTSGDYVLSMAPTALTPTVTAAATNEDVQS